MAESNENFLTDFLAFNERTEIPQMFSIWSAISCLSCALGRRVFINQGRFQIYPNLYIILLAPPGRFRKSTSIDVARELIEQLDPKPNLAPSKVTPEAFYDVLHSIIEGANLTLNPPDSTAFAFVRELEVMINLKSFENGFAGILNDGFDCAKTMDYQTKKRGKETAYNTCFGFIGATTITGLNGIIPEGSLGQGLASRFIFVHETIPAQPWSRPPFEDRERILYERLIRSLKRISIISGECRMTDEAWSFYDDEYNEWAKTGGAGDSFFSESATEGYASRKFVHLLKLGMIFSASEGSLEGGRLVIKRSHLDAGLEALRIGEKHLKKVVELVQMNSKGGDIDRIRRLIKKHSPLSRSDLLRLVSNKISSKDLSEIVETLIHSNEILVLNQGNVPMFHFNHRKDEE